MFAVIGGTVLDQALGPVVALATDDGAGQEVFCSGVVVGPAHVLTAAHCARHADELVAGGADASVLWGSEVRGWAAVEVHPEASELDHDHDLAVITLDGDAPTAPAALATEPPAVGDEVALYGFGASSEGGTDAGTQRGTRLEVLEVDELVFRSFAPGTNVCSGDSGGPAVGTVDDGWWVVGIDTFVDPTCLGGTAGSTRVDAHLDWLADVVGELVLDPIGPPERGLTAEVGCRTGPAPTVMWGAVVLVGALSRRRAAGPPQVSSKSA